MNEGLQALLDRLWTDYTALHPQAEPIHRLLTGRGEQVVHDHIALRTFRHPKFGIDACARLFEQHGYRVRGEYAFPRERVHARHYESDRPGLPKLLISELELEGFSRGLRDIVNSLMRQIDPATLPEDAFVLGGCPWYPILHDTWERLHGESPYTAWVAAFGFRVHHFTVLVNALGSFDSLAALNAFLGENGFTLDGTGGEIKGSPETLQWSMTATTSRNVQFADAEKEVPGCHYEFVWRHPLPEGTWFGGFPGETIERVTESTE